MKSETIRTTTVVRREGAAAASEKSDEVAVEEPLEIRVEGRSVAVVMRTPGHDRELAAGFALSEGIVRRPDDIFEITSCLTNAATKGNVVEISLTNPAAFDAAKLSRHIFSS
ncbi:MAG TPA: formate dehydrogenase accessory sulfurtransferase FdhD, partial [Chthoniobacterales bacterium]